VSRGRVAFRCDAGPAMGVGHVLRCIALAEELAQRGLEIVFVADLGGIALAVDHVARRGFAVCPPDGRDPVAQLLALDPDAVVLDGYHLDARIGAGLRAADVRVLALRDGEFGAHLPADVVLDQNPHTAPVLAPHTSAVHLAGLRYALLRDDVRTRRPATPRTHTHRDRLDVVVVLGGTDPSGAALDVSRLLLSTHVPMDATIVAAREPIAVSLRRLPPGPGQRVDVVAPSPQIMDRVWRADVVISAAGSAMWELCCLGVACAAVIVTDNQRQAYRAVVADGLVQGLGHAHEVATSPTALRGLSRLLTDHDLRTALSARAWTGVDGRGRMRVADTLIAKG
jgi:spore coat polysaccharide biosynthesis predicted glycosyltransferase SpsG